MIGVFIPVGCGNRRDRPGYVVTESGCWEWVGNRSRGYGRVSNGKGRYVVAHRYIWEQFNGALPSALELDHLCRNTACVRPDHMEPVTPRVNVLRSNGLAGINARKSHCPKGHRLVATSYDPSRRHCPTCRANRDWSIEYKRRKAKRQAHALNLSRDLAAGGNDGE